MLIALAATVIYFAQAASGGAAPDAAPLPVTIQPLKREAAAPAPATDFSTATQVAPKDAKTVAPLTVTGTPQAKAVIANNTMVCQTEPVLGSLFPKKVCATRSEIADRKAVDQAEVRKWQAQRPFRSN